jgi:hypothetical protein
MSVEHQIDFLAAISILSNIAVILLAISTWNRKKQPSQKSPQEPR